MRLLLNILWFIFGGFISGTLWILAGVILAITIIGPPWTPAAFRIAGFSYWPFGRVVEDRDDGAVSLLLNIVWLVFAGWWLAIHHIVLAAGLAVTNHRHPLRLAARQARHPVADAGRQGRGPGPMIVRPYDLWLWTRLDNVGAQRFYERHGLVAQDTAPHPTSGYLRVRYRWTA
jgi:uncharacterized membrane protein YccF (DUF307 family)